MTNALIKFSEDTKTSCYAITAGMFIIAVAAATGSITGTLVSGALRLLGIVTLVVAVIGLANHTQILYTGTPNAINDKGVISNVLACGCLCLVVLAIIVYGSYTIVF
jgi:hypothetical protein